MKSENNQLNIKSFISRLSLGILVATFVSLPLWTGCDDNANQLSWGKPQLPEAGGGLPYCDPEPGKMPMDKPVVYVPPKPPVTPPEKINKPPKELYKPVVEIVGKSVLGTPIKSYTFGKGKNPVFIFGGIHGEERAAAAVATMLVNYLKKHPEFYSQKRIVIIDRANPDGLAVGRRVNENGVDLNRNFPASNFDKKTARFGKTPLSQPEAKALYKVMNKLKPSVTVSIHTCRRGRHGNNWDGTGKKYADAMSKFNRYKSFTDWHSPTPGSFGSWAGVDKKQAIVTLEIPNDMSDSAAWRENVGALLELIRIAPKAK